MVHLIIHKSLRFGSLRKTPSFTFSQWLHFGSLETVACMFVLKLIFMFKHTKQPCKHDHHKKTKTEELRPWWQRPQGKQTPFAKHNLKYPEASLSSLLKLVFGFLQPKKGHATKLLQHISTEYIHGYIYKNKD